MLARAAGGLQVGVPRRCGVFELMDYFLGVKGARVCAFTNLNN